MNSSVLSIPPSIYREYADEYKKRVAPASAYQARGFVSLAAGDSFRSLGTLLKHCEAMPANRRFPPPHLRLLIARCRIVDQRAKLPRHRPATLCGEQESRMRLLAFKLAQSS
jgi:hypothetical protein